MQHKMTEHLKTFLLNNLSEPDDIPQEYRRSVMRDRQMLQFSFRLRDGLLEQVQHSIFYDDKILPIAAKIDIATDLNYEKNLNNIVLLSSMLSPDGMMKNVRPTLPDKPKIEALCEEMLKDVSFSKIEFQKSSAPCKCVQEKCEHYYLFHIVLRDHLSDTWSSLFFTMLFEVIEKFQRKLKDDIRGKFHEMSGMNPQQLPRNISESITKKSGNQFFGIDQNDTDYALTAHKEVHAVLYNLAQIESMYDAQQIQRANDLGSWLKILTKRNGRKEWVKHLYK
jgi:hypothetical protein